MRASATVLLFTSALAFGAFAQQPPPPPIELGDAVLLATNSLQLDRDVVVTRGDLVVNEANALPLSIARGVTTPAGFSLKANSIVIDPGAVINGDVKYNSLQNGGTINGALVTPLALPVISPLPTAPARASGTQDVSVANGANSVVGTGDYGKLSVGKDATLHLAGGPYTFSSISAESGAKIVWDGSGEVVVNGGIALGANTSVIAGPNVTTKHKLFFANGDVSIGKSNTISGTIWALNNVVNADQSLTLTGAIVARDIHIGQGSTLTLRSGFRNLPPVADDQTVRVGAIPVLITLTGSDPDADPLTFAIQIRPINGTVTDPVSSGPTSAAVTYTPDFQGAGDVFTFRVTDSEGFFADGVVTINDGAPLPGPPATITAQAATVEVPQNEPSIIPLNATAPPDVPVTISIVGSGPSHGSLGPLTQPSVNPPHPGEVVYVPQQGYVGEDSFQFQACGTIAGNQVCSIATISLAVKGPEVVGDLAPDLTVTTASGSPLPIGLNPSNAPAYRILTLPRNGFLTDGNGARIGSAPYALPSPLVVYQSNAGFAGSDSFTYDATAGTQVDSGTVTVNVTASDNGR